MADRDHWVNWMSLLQAREHLPDALYSHLADEGSLTRRVRERCRGDFGVCTLSLHRARPGVQECQLLALGEEETVLVREVFLSCEGQARVFARTLIGMVEKNAALTARIQALGERSLGSILFRDPLAIRRQMELAELAPDHPFFSQLESTGFDLQEAVWVRRSLYDYQGSELIVYEAFVDFPVP